MHSLSLTDKPGFIIDKKIYNEEEFKKILPSVINSFSSGVGTGTGGANDSFLNHGLDVSGYDVIFSFNTKKPGNPPPIALTKHTESILEKMHAFETGNGKELPERQNDSDKINPKSKDTVNNSGHTKQKESTTKFAYNNVLFHATNPPFPATHFGIVVTKPITQPDGTIKYQSGHMIIGDLPGTNAPIIIPYGFEYKNNM